MEHSKKLVLFLVLVVILSLNLYALVLRRSPVRSASAIETGPNIGVYWDQGCMQNVDSIPWGILQLGGTQEVDVYVRNEGTDTFYLNITTQDWFYLNITTQDWQPGSASQWLDFSWSCQNITMAANQVVEVNQTLHVPPDFQGGFSSFNFSIAFQGGPHLLGDINYGGKVDLQDLQILAAAYNSRPGDRNWNPAADLNNDGVVNLSDLIIVAEEYGQTD